MVGDSSQWARRCALVPSGDWFELIAEANVGASAEPTTARSRARVLARLNFPRGSRTEAGETGKAQCLRTLGDERMEWRSVVASSTCQARYIRAITT